MGPEVFWGVRRTHMMAEDMRAGARDRKLWPTCGQTYSRRPSGTDLNGRSEGFFSMWRNGPKTSAG